MQQILHMLVVTIVYNLGLLGFSGTSKAEGGGLERLLGEKPHQVRQSVHLVRLSDGKTLFARNPDHLVSPASITKILTSAAALCRYGPSFVIKTPLFYTGERKNHSISGDLIVVGKGDPFIVSEKLWQLASDLRNLGIREFRGNLVVDQSLFSGAARDESRLEGKDISFNSFDAPVSAFGVNFNTFTVTVAPSEIIGHQAYVSLDPYPLRDVFLENHVKTAQGKVGKSLQVKRVSDESGPERLVATGIIHSDTPILKIYRSIGGNPIRISGEYLKAFLKNEGIIVTGAVKEGVKPAGAKPLMEIEGYEMRRVVHGLNNFSNNYIADVLVKRLGASFPKSGNSEAPGSGNYENGLSVVSDFLRKEVKISSEFKLLNGSGLATENRLTARQVTDVLRYMEQRMDVFPDFLASLPATGLDGTLRKRFSNQETESYKGLFRAKTGTLSEPIAVSGLAGYFRHPKHGLIAFALLENGPEQGAQPSIMALRERQDRVLVEFMNEF